MDGLRDLIPVGWRATVPHYRCKDYVDLPTVLVLFDAIEPPRRDPGIMQFDMRRLRSLADGIIKGEPIPPIEVSILARSDAHRYRVHNGFHRFYLCKELGFTAIPAVDVTGLSI
jgi:hypothetical protein